MSKRPTKKKRVGIERAAPTGYAPGGSLLYVPPGVAQSTLGQTFYGSALKNMPVGQSALFSPGIPLEPQPGVDPLGKPTAWRFPVAWNTYVVDRTGGSPDIPSFEQLRRLAKMYSGITLNERYWLDLVPRMTLDIRLKKKYADQGAEPQNYQKEITALKTFWEKPDGRHDLHTWLRMNLREQSQIDELYWYRNRTRGRKLLGLWIVDGAQMKPLLDDWGMLPEAPNYAYQQYPWGIPGMRYSMDQMIHYQETPAADSPFGFGRVERFILEVNQALRKKKKDLANFTEGNIPQSFMEVPEGLNWTPDQIDAFEQSWNALIAGNAQQQIRMKFLQPGMKYTPAEQYPITFDPDLFLFKIACGCYGVPVTEFGFTEDSNRSSGESQEDMVYRRTIGPIALSYAFLMTDVMATDFPDQHGEMFEAYFGGYEEIEDAQKKAGAITMYTGAGILGLTDAAKMANLPIDPDAPPIGRMIMTANGPVWLDDVATPEMRKAQSDATMAGYQMAANPPEPAAPGDGEKATKPGQKADKQAPEEDPDTKATMSRVVEVLERAEEAMRLMRARDITGEIDEQRAPENPAIAPRIFEDSGRENSSDAARATTASAGQSGTSRDDNAVGPSRDDERQRAISQEFRRWREVALKDVKAGRPVRRFVSDVIPEDQQSVLREHLSLCTTPEGVRAVFPVFHEQQPLERDTSPKDLAANVSVNGGSPASNRSAWKLRW